MNVASYFAGPKPSASVNPAVNKSVAGPVKPAKVAVVTPANTETLEPAVPSHGNSQRFYQPLYPGQKPTGYEPAPRGPGGSAGTRTATRPYWLATRGPKGDSASQLNAADLAKAQKAGVQPTIAMTLLNSTVHPITDLGQQITGTKPFKLGGAASDVANIASNLVPVGKAAGILGSLRGLKALKDAKAGAEALDTAKAAKAAKTVAVAKEPQAALRGALKGARVVRGKQEAGYSAERAQRIAAANVHLTNQNLAPAERLALAKNELKGELPKIDFQGMKVLDDQALAKLQTHILDHPHLMPFQKITASTALANAVAGKVPTRGELTLLEHVFGKDTANSLGKIHAHPFKDTILSALNVPRSLMASFDLSAPFRQGLVVGTRHPSIFFRNFGPMVKAFGSERVYQTIHTDIRARPTYPMMMEAKLALTDLGHDLGSREEQFASNIAEKIPVAGHGVRASGRAYTGFLDKTRADVFDHLIGQAEQQGLNVQDPQFLKSLGTYINSATGRGDLGHFQEAGKVLNTFLFSPRLLASRLNFLNPSYYARLDPFARKEALRSAVQLAGTLSTLLALASRVPGVQVITDPRNPDWGKIRLGNTRIDIAGGFQQPLRLLAELATGVAISSTTGKKLNLTAGGFGQPNRLDLFLRFFEGKESPIASFVTDYMRNSNQVGTKFKWTPEVSQRLIPLLAQDSYDLYNQHHGGMNGLAAAFAGYGIGSVGLGLQTYGPKPPTASKKPAAYFGSSSVGGGSPYFAPTSSAGAGGGYFGGR